MKPAAKPIPVRRYESDADDFAGGRHQPDASRCQPALSAALELVIHAYYMGETPEGIVDSYPSLTASDVYAVIGYYLANRADIDAYVRQRDAQADRILRDMEANLPPKARALRTRLRAYQERQKETK